MLTARISMAVVDLIQRYDQQANKKNRGNNGLNDCVRICFRAESGNKISHNQDHRKIAQEEQHHSRLTKIPESDQIQDTPCDTDSIKKWKQNSSTPSFSTEINGLSSANSGTQLIFPYKKVNHFSNRVNQKHKPEACHKQASIGKDVVSERNSRILQHHHTAPHS